MTAREEVKANKKAAAAPQRKALIETIKTVLIAVLITGVISFVSGMHYQASVQADKDSAVAAVKSEATLKK